MTDNINPGVLIDNAQAKFNDFFAEYQENGGDLSSISEFMTGLFSELREQLGVYTLA